MKLDTRIQHFQEYLTATGGFTPLDEKRVDVEGIIARTHKTLLDKRDEMQHPRDLRSELDDLCELKIYMIRAIAIIKAAVAESDALLEDSKAEIICNTKISSFGNMNAASYEEREAFYNTKVADKVVVARKNKNLLSSYEQTLKYLDVVYNQWNQRRQDLKWENSDYNNINNSEYH